MRRNFFQNVWLQRKLYTLFLGGTTKLKIFIWVLHFMQSYINHFSPHSLLVHSLSLSLFSLSPYLSTSHTWIVSRADQLAKQKANRDETRSYRQCHIEKLFYRGVRPLGSSHARRYAFSRNLEIRFAHRLFNNQLSRVKSNQLSCCFFVIGSHRAQTAVPMIHRRLTLFKLMLFYRR